MRRPATNTYPVIVASISDGNVRHVRRARVTSARGLFRLQPAPGTWRELWITRETAVALGALSVGKTYAEFEDGGEVQVRTQAVIDSVPEPRRNPSERKRQSPDLMRAAGVIQELERHGVYGWSVGERDGTIEVMDSDNEADDDGDVWSLVDAQTRGLPFLGARPVLLVADLEPSSRYDGRQLWEREFASLAAFARWITTAGDVSPRLEPLGWDFTGEY